MLDLINCLEAKGDEDDEDDDDDGEDDESTVVVYGCLRPQVSEFGLVVYDVELSVASRHRRRRRW